MIFGSVCSGIEAASVAWRPLGWRCAFMSEIEPFPRAVLKHHYRDTPLHGDFTTIQGGQYEPIDLLVGGTPCQSFSVAGLRGGLSDDRGNLALEFLRLADRLRPRWLVWENVPGVLSSTSHDAPDLCPPDIDLDTGHGPADGEEIVVEDSYDADESHAFACFLAGLSELGYGWAYRQLDAQYFGLAQRRRRVFVVGHLGDWRRPAAVLLERHSLSGNPAPSRKARERPAPTVAGGARERGGFSYDDIPLAQSLRAQAQPSHRGDSDAYVPAAFGGNDTRGAIEIATAVNAHGGPHGRQDFESETFVATTLRARDMAKGVDSDCTDTLIAHALRGEGFDASEDGTGRGTPLVAVHGTQDPDVLDDQAHALGGNHGQENAICFSSKDYGADAEVDLAPTLRAGGHDESHANAGVPPAVAYSIMPQNSGKDFKAREVSVAQPVMADGPGRGEQGGDYIVQPILEVGARTGVSTTDIRAGSGIGDDGDPMFTLQAGKQHAVAFALRGRDGGALPEVCEDGSVGALRAASGGSSRDYIAFDTTQVTHPANHSNPQPGDACHPLAAGAHPPAIAGSAVRRLTPKECCRLQGFPDDYLAQVTWRGASPPPRRSHV